MSREPFDQALVDEFERELRDALAIEPSPDFARQVRARIASRRPSRIRWTVGLAAAAVCVVAVGLGVWVDGNQGTRVPGCQGARVPGCEGAKVPEYQGAKVLKPNAAFEASSSTAPPPSTNRMRPANVLSRPETLPEPEVIVPPERALALARLLQLAREGAVDEETLQPVASAASPATLEIEALIVVPIPVAEIETPSAATQGGADRE